jgi:acid phosphatase class B
LPKDFHQNLFFLRLSIKLEPTLIKLKGVAHHEPAKEPGANEMNEHYCRRWVSIRTIEQSLEQKKSHFFDAQISSF